MTTEMTDEGKIAWEFALDTTRHRVELAHSPITGRRELWLDGVSIYKVGVKYKLTGMIAFPLGAHECVIAIDASTSGQMVYTLMIDNKVIKAMHVADIDTKLVRWTVKSGHTEFPVVFDKDSFDVYVDGVLYPTRADFADVGSVYCFNLPDRSECRIEVVPTKKPEHPEVDLYVDHTKIEHDTAAPVSAADAASAKK